MISFHFPPFKSSSGIQRIMGFGRYLPEHGWVPIVLTPRASAYPAVSDHAVDTLPEPAIVHRSPALDVGRHLSVRGRYLSWMATPDRWNSWLLSGIPAGLRLIRKHRPRVLWSTFPTPTAHLIGLGLHRLTGIPWVADFRDPMVYEGWPVGARQRRAFSWIESRVIRHCHAAVLTTPSTRALYSQRYPDVDEDRLHVIPNGYDETVFGTLRGHDIGGGNRGGPYTLVHSGLMEPADRDPSAFFTALRMLRDSGTIGPDRVRIVLRASGQDERYERQIDELGITDLVHLGPAVPYHEALEEMLRADGLLLFQGSNCNRQIPAKAYEYMRANRPIFVLADPAGDTAATMREHGIDSMAPLDSAETIAAAFPQFLDRLERGEAPLADQALVRRYSRARLTRDLATILDSLVD